MSEIRIANLTITDAVVQYDPSKGTITLPAPEQVKEAVEPKFEMWKPELGAEYYSINSQGTVNRQTNENDNFDIAWIEVGNCFPTEEIAKLEHSCRLLGAEITQLRARGLDKSYMAVTKLSVLRDSEKRLVEMWKPYLMQAQEGQSNAI